MDRREFMKFGGVAAIELGAARLLMSQAQPGMPGMQPAAAAQENSKADFTLRIAPVTVELTPTRIISTIGYNGTSPGPVLRMKEGKPVTVDVINETDVPELVHWHGLFIPADVDGVEEENTPMVPPHGRIRYQFTPRPAGTRWYHTHTMAGSDLHRGAYTGQFGFLMIESANNPGNYDQEVFLALREWEPFFNPEEEDDDDCNQLRTATREAQDARYQPLRPRSGLPDVFHQRQSHGSGRTDSRPAGPESSDAFAEREREHEPPHRPSRATNFKLSPWMAIRFPRRNPWT